MIDYLKSTDIIDYHDKHIQEQAKLLALDCDCDEQIARACFEFVRDEIKHSGDYPSDIPTTCKASEVLKYKTGWCYSKAILLAALLRANGIPAGFGYQRLSCSEYKPNIYCLHGLNYVYLQKYGWYRVDARGNKEGVDAQFTPPIEKLAFEVGDGEYDILENLSEPLPEVIEALKKNKSYKEMVDNFPDIK